MNAYELADELNACFTKADWEYVDNAVNMLRQQADRIAKLEKEVSDLKYEKSSGVYDVEPVAWIDKVTGKPKMIGYIFADYDIPLYLHPAKTLTNEEIEEVMYKCDWAYDPVEFAKAILKKAQEK